MGREDKFPKATYWNVWWTLTVITAAATLIVALLEGLGVFHDLGVALSVAGIILSILFGVTASTRSAVGTVTAGVAALREDMVGTRAEIGTIRDGIGTVREEVGGVREEIGGVREEIGSLREEMGGVREAIVALESPLTTPLNRILATLVERLPPAPSR